VGCEPTPLSASRWTHGTADKFVCMYRIRPNAGKFNAAAMLAYIELTGVWLKYV